MEYLVFPFGKYRGTKLEELPSTYIVLALEKFELPQELKESMFRILLGRFYVYSGALDNIKSMTKKELVKFYESRVQQYENL